MQHTHIHTHTHMYTHTHTHNLTVVAVYEKTKQHTIIPMCIMIGIQLVMLVTFLLVYIKLARTVETDQQESTPHTDQVEEEEEVVESEPEHEETELTHLVPEKTDS